MRFLFFWALAFAPASAMANHVMVNCGSPGYWDHSVPLPPQKQYVMIMSDDAATAQNQSGTKFELGAVTHNSHRSIRDIELDQFRERDTFQGRDFLMTLEREFTRSRQKKDRRFFRASFQARPKGGASFGGPIECAVGLK